MKTAICGRCGDVKEVKRELMGCLGQVVIICSDCEVQAKEQNIPWWDWMTLPMRTVEATWQWSKGECA